MARESTDKQNEGFTLIEVDKLRSPDDRATDGTSGDNWYSLEYLKEEGSTTIRAKPTEIGELDSSNHADLRPLAEEGFTHYGIFRQEDRSTTTIVQDSKGNTFKAFSFSRNNVKISHPVTIEKMVE